MANYENRKTYLSLIETNITIVIRDDKSERNKKENRSGWKIQLAL